VHAYRARISGPLLDRIDLVLEVPRVPVTDISAARAARAPGGAAPPLTSTDAAVAVARARERQIRRSGCLNGELSHSQLQAFATPTPAARQLLEQVFERLGLTARSYHRVLRVALTIADLAGSDVIGPEHLAEAVQLRRAAGAFSSAPAR
jgi:magnesium chelatase family protein